MQITAGDVSEQNEATSEHEIHQVILKEGEQMMAGSVRKLPRLECRLKLEENGRLLLRDDDLGKLFQSDSEGPEGPHYVALENGQLRIYRGTTDIPEEVRWETPKPSDAGPYRLGITASKRLAIFRDEGKNNKIVWMSPVQD